MKKKVLERAKRALNSYLKAEIQLIKAIKEYVKESNEIVPYDILINDCETVTRFVVYDYETDKCHIENEFGVILCSLESMSADELEEILRKLALKEIIAKL